MILTFFVISSGFTYLNLRNNVALTVSISIISNSSLLQVDPGNRPDVDRVLHPRLLNSASCRSASVDLVISTNERIEASTADIAGLTNIVLRKTIGVSLLVGSVQERLKGMETTLLDKLKVCSLLPPVLRRSMNSRSCLHFEPESLREATSKLRSQEYMNDLTDARQCGG